MTNHELFETVEKSNVISKEVTDILLELDTTASVTTQASLEELLSTLYKRLSDEDISIEVIGDHVTKEQFVSWVDDNYDDYSRKLFEEENE